MKFGHEVNALPPRACVRAETAPQSGTGSALRQIVAVALFSAATMAHAAAGEAAASISDLYNGYLEAGVLSGKHKAWSPLKVSMRLHFMRTEAQYRVPDSVAFTFPLKWMDSSDAVPIMEAVVSDLGRVCEAQSGELKFEPKQGPHDPKADRVLAPTEF